ncbi:shikimate dehydrogenase [Ideonella alba]|uniref:Shikimate dehydrogenase (NADP(+)) n=1 Tax=Ideonella alba TaxID=2824118 RepID=A0A940Y642_9BURK|nr:shikimate dehydrogenase [Ideonella alba]MBQ0929391.1 shikimate dehydrogenase [Ideonella alba]
MNATVSDPALTLLTPATPQGLLGLIGSGIGQSLTPALHQQEAGHHGLRLHYQLIDLDRFGGSAADLPWLLSAVRAIGFGGLNITYPCKQAVIPHLDELSDEAREMGAVNTVVIRDGRLIGHNTDGSGWARGFRRALPQADLGAVALLGAGGAGAAIAHAVLRLGADELRIVDADPARAAALAAELGPRARAAADAAQALAGATGLIHATPTGMAKLPGLPLDAGLLHAGQWVSEVVYFPLDTALLREARARGCAVSDGGGMAVGQALGAFELFTGLTADADRVEHHFRQLVALRQRGEC